MFQRGSIFYLHTRFADGQELITLFSLTCSEQGDSVLPKTPSVRMVLLVILQQWSFHARPCDMVIPRYQAFERGLMVLPPVYISVA